MIRPDLPTYAYAHRTPHTNDMVVIDEDTGMEYTGVVHEINTEEGWAMIYSPEAVFHADDKVRVEGDFRLMWREDYDQERAEKNERFKKRYHEIHGALV